jgi:hypothetical protein
MRLGYMREFLLDAAAILALVLLAIAGGGVIYLVTHV